MDANVRYVECKFRIDIASEVLPTIYANVLIYVACSIGIGSCANPNTSDASDDNNSPGCR